MPGKENGSPNSDNSYHPPKADLLPKDKRTNTDKAAGEPSKEHEAAQQKLDRDLVRWTRALAFFTAALVVVAVLQFWAMRGQLNEMTATRESSDRSFADQIAVMRTQTKAMQGQLDQMASAQRAWVKLADARPVGVDVENGVAIINVGLELENSGHSPAQDVSVGVDVLPSLSITDERKEVTIACGNAPKIAGSSEIIFPGETRRAEEFAFPITIDAIKRDRDEQVRTGAMSRLSLDYPLSATFNIVGCVTYKWGGPAPGQTAFILDVGRSCKESPVGKCSFDVSSPVTYTGDQMRVKEVRRSLFAK